MAVINKKEREDGVIECLIDSSNILKSEYKESDKSLVITFKSGLRYQYFDVLHRDYVRFEISESQGSVFNKTMKNYEYEKLDKIDAETLKEEIKNLKDGTVQTTDSKDPE